MPFLAILQNDLAVMARSWIARGYVGLASAAVILDVLNLQGGLINGEDLLANVIGNYPSIWAIFVIVMCAGAVSNEIDILAHSIMSKAVTRYDYILAKLSARLIAVLLPYLGIVLLSGFLVANNAQTDVTAAGFAWAMTLVGMILFTLTSFTVALSTILNGTGKSLIIVWFVWYSASFLFALIGLEYLSPIAIAEDMPDILVGDYKASDNIRILASFTALSAFAFGSAIVRFRYKDL